MDRIKDWSKGMLLSIEAVQVLYYPRLNQNLDIRTSQHSQGNFHSTLPQPFCLEESKLRGGQ